MLRSIAGSVGYIPTCSGISSTSRGSDEMRKMELAEGRCVEFHYHGFRLGRIVKIKGNHLTVVLAPFMLRGRRKGKKVRIEKTAVIGIVWRKEVIEWHV